MSTERCRWWMNCENDATTTRHHLTLGEVPLCQRCDDRVAAIGSPTADVPPMITAALR